MGHGERVYDASTLKQRQEIVSLTGEKEPIVLFRHSCALSILVPVCIHNLNSTDPERFLSGMLRPTEDRMVRDSDVLK